MTTSPSECRLKCLVLLVSGVHCRLDIDVMEILLILTTVV